MRSRDESTKDLTSSQPVKPISIDEFVKTTLAELMTELRALCRPIDQPLHSEAAPVSERDLTAGVELLDEVESELSRRAALSGASPGEDDVSSPAGQGSTAGAQQGAQVPYQHETIRPSIGSGTSCPEAAQPLASMAADIKRIADKLDPPPASIVGSEYIAGRLGCTTTWVAEMCRKGDIPASCVVAGTGNGKLWKFYRLKIDQWLETR